MTYKPAPDYAYVLPTSFLKKEVETVTSCIPIPHPPTLLSNYA